MKPLIHGFVYGIIDCLLVLEPDLHFCRMDIHIHFFSRHGDHKDHKGILMLHGKILVGVFDSLRYNVIFNISAVDKIVFKVPVSAGDDRLSEKTGDLYPFRLEADLQQVGRNLPAVNVIDHIS